MYYVIRSIWLSAAITAFVGIFIWPLNGREEMASDVAKNMLLAGKALSGITSCLMPPWPNDEGPEQSRSVTWKPCLPVKVFVVLYFCRI